MQKALGFLSAAALLCTWCLPAQAASFHDLGRSAWATAAVTVLAAEGAVRGTAPGQFSPSIPMTREALAVLLARVLALPAKGALAFRDARTVSEWARQGVRAAVAAGILKGVGNGRLLPLAPVTRAEAASMLARAFGLAQGATTAPYRDRGSVPAWARGAVDRLTALGVVTGFPDHTFRPSAPLTRAACAVLLVRLEALAGRPLPSADTVVGHVATVVYPQNALLVAGGGDEGPGGGLALGTGPLHPVAPTAALYLGSLGRPSTVFGFTTGDAAVAVLGPGGEVTAAWDVTTPLSPPTLRDADPGHLYLSDGTVLDLPQGYRFTYAKHELPAAAAGALLGSRVDKVDQGGLISLGPVAFAGVVGTVEAVSPGSLTVFVTADPTGGLFPAGLTTFARTAATQMEATLPEARSLAAGDTVTLFGELGQGPEPVLSRVLY